MQQIIKSQNQIWFVYDGECPLCNLAAKSLQIKKAVGNLNLLDARTNSDHFFMKEINKRNLNLDEGMVLIYNEQYFQGKDALHMMALLGSEQGWFNKMNAILFRSKIITTLCYPLMRFIRNSLIKIKGINKIYNLEEKDDEPVFKKIFGEEWDNLPLIIKQHYMVRPYSDDVVKVEGHLNIKISFFVSILAKFTSMLVPYSGENIPVTVIFKSGKKEKGFHFKRIFHYPIKGDFHFNSCMEQIKDNIVVEFLRFGIGWKLSFNVINNKIILKHEGYVWRILGLVIPIPLEFIMGKGYAEEIIVSNDEFEMWTHAKHFLFGETFYYAGKFRVTECSCKEKF